MWKTDVGNFRPFFGLKPPPPLKNQKILNFENKRKLLEISLFYTSVPKITIICCTVPEVSSETQNFYSLWAIFCHFTPLMIPKIKIVKKWKKYLGDIILLHMGTINEDHMIWFLKYKVQQTYFLSIQAIFCPFTPLTTQKIKN